MWRWAFLKYPALVKAISNNYIGEYIMASITDLRRLIKQLQGEILVLRERAESARQWAIQTGNWERHHHYNKEISKRNNLISIVRLKVLAVQLKEANALSRFYKKTNPAKHSYWQNELKRLKTQLNTVKTIVEKQVKTTNENASIAHDNMLMALQNGDQDKAFEFREDRDHFNKEAAQLMDHLVLAIKAAFGEAENSAPPAPPVSTFPSKKIAEAFEKDHYQDHAHRAIFKELLEGKYSKKNMKNDPNSEAFDAIRKNYLAPLYFINNNIHLDYHFGNAIPVDDDDRQKYLSPQLKIDHKKKPATFFIRDFMGIRSKGNLVIKNWLIEDSVLDSDFADDFDDLVVDINAHLATVAVNKFKDVAHRDVMQLIPAPNKTGSDQMAGAIMSDVIIEENIMHSKGQLNCIFGSDGAFKNLSIRNNHIQTKGAHTISISGMLSGKITGNTDLQGAPLPPNKIKLLPLRIGGGANIYIIGFKNKPGTPEEEKYEYKAIPGVPVNDCSNASVGPRDQYGDMRRCIEGSYAATTRDATFYDKVDMQEFHKEYAKRPNIVKEGRQKQAYQAIMQTLVDKGFAVKVEPGTVSSHSHKKVATG